MTLQGRIVEYMEQGVFYTALVLEENGRRLRILNHKGRECNLPAGRVVHHGSQRPVTGDSRTERLEFLKGLHQGRQRIAADLDLRELWEAVVEEESGKQLPVRLLAELCLGDRLDDDHLAAFLRAVFANRFFFKYKDRQLLVHSPEVVANLEQQAAREAEKKALLKRGAGMLARLWQGEETGDWPERRRCLELVRDFYLFGKDAEESGLARQLLKDAGLTGPHAAYELLVRIGYWRRHENIALLRQQLPVDFPPEVIAEAESLPKLDVNGLLAAGYKDLRDLPLMTIDGATTRDFDDALHIEEGPEGQVQVGIHITNVAHYVRPGTALFAEARRRVTSIYFADRQVPMLPAVLSEGRCSLFAGRERAAISFLITLAPDGEVISRQIVPSIVTVKRKLTYDQVDQLVGSDADLSRLFAVSRQQQARRVANGAVIMPIPDVCIDFQGEDPAGVRLCPVDTPGRLLVAELMVLANAVTALYLADRQLPCLYRSQNPPSQRLVREPEDNLFVNFRQRKHLSPGVLSTTPSPHSGVGVPCYTTVTSPIRRFLDLIVQHQLLHQILGKGMLFDEARFQAWGGDIYQQQGRVNLVRQQRHRYWLLTLLAKRVGELLECLIIGKGPKRVKLVLMEYLLECDLPANNAIANQPGETVMVRLASVRPLDGSFRMEW